VGGLEVWVVVPRSSRPGFLADVGILACEQSGPHLLNNDRAGNLHYPVQYSLELSLLAQLADASLDRYLARSAEIVQAARYPRFKLMTFPVTGPNPPLMQERAPALCSGTRCVARARLDNLMRSVRRGLSVAGLRPN
jgi:hypothetical protein